MRCAPAQTARKRMIWPACDHGAHLDPLFPLVPFAVGRKYTAAEASATSPSCHSTRKIGCTMSVESGSTGADAMDGSSMDTRLQEVGSMLHTLGNRFGGRTPPECNKRNRSSLRLANPHGRDLPSPPAHLKRCRASSRHFPSPSLAPLLGSCRSKNNTTRLPCCRCVECAATISPSRPLLHE